MELTLESIFSANGLLGHFSYVLLIISMLSISIVWLRVGVIGSALAGIGYSAFIINDPVSLFWESLLLLVNIVQLIRTVMHNRLIKFSDEEIALRQSVLRELSNFDARSILDLGFWMDGEIGAELIREENAVNHLFYIATGSAEVHRQGQIVGRCVAGEMVGESVILSNQSASGTVKLAAPSRLWGIAAPVLRKYLISRPDLRSKIERQIGDSLQSKLQNANRAVASLGGV